jgi:hypothetical protein
MWGAAEGRQHCPYKSKGNDGYCYTVDEVDREAISTKEDLLPKNAYDENIKWWTQKYQRVES